MRNKTGFQSLTISSHTGYYECAVNDSASEPLVSYSPYEPTDLPTRGTACVGPRGVRMNESTADLLHAYSQTCESMSHRYLRDRMPTPMLTH